MASLFEACASAALCGITLTHCNSRLQRCDTTQVVYALFFNETSAYDPSVCWLCLRSVMILTALSKDAFQTFPDGSVENVSSIQHLTKSFVFWLRCSQNKLHWFTHMCRFLVLYFMTKPSLNSCNFCILSPIILKAHTLGGRYRLWKMYVCAKCFIGNAPS